MFDGLKAATALSRHGLRDHLPSVCRDGHSVCTAGNTKDLLPFGCGWNDVINNGVYLVRSINLSGRHFRGKVIVGNQVHRVRSEQRGAIIMSVK